MTWDFGLSMLVSQVMNLFNSSLNRDSQRGIEDKRQDLQRDLERLRLEQQHDFQRWRFGEEKKLQQALAAYNRETQLMMADRRREEIRHMAEVNKIFQNWPLTIVPSQIIDSHDPSDRLPLAIFLAPPKQGLAPDVEAKLAEGLSSFLNKGYGLHNPIRPTEFLGGAWSSESFRREASIKALFSMLKANPTLILESEVDGDELILRLGYWGLGPRQYFYKTIATLPYCEMLVEAAKARALAWRERRDSLLRAGYTSEEVDKFGGDNVENLRLLEQEEKLSKYGVDLQSHYKIDRKDYESVYRVLTTCHCLIAGWVADIHYLIQHDVPPLLPTLFADLKKELAAPQAQEVLEQIVAGYRQVYETLAQERPAWLPELTLQLAHSLASLEQKSFAAEQLEHSIHAWLDLRQVPKDRRHDLVAAMESVLEGEDSDYLEKLRECYKSVGENEYADRVDALLGTCRKRLSQTFEFEVVTVDEWGEVVERRKGSARYFTEDLGDGVKLDMVELPGGSFLMGSPETEKRRDSGEGPQHLVIVPSFFMGKYPVTQAQWRAVANLPAIHRALDPAPSHFEGDDLPVECVPWEDAVEFCKRLAQKTGRPYRLPSEAEWEYACRAGTTTPFHFGEAITPELVNYNGGYPYGAVPRGAYRDKTTPVGSFKVANAFGLYDMHGNVWEWCRSLYKPYPYRAEDGREDEADSDYRVLRGGAFDHGARNVRCACRSIGGLYPPDSLGFRVVVSPFFSDR